MLSSNIIERHHQLADLANLSLYPVMVIALAILCWRLKEWI